MKKIIIVVISVIILSFTIFVLIVKLTEFDYLHFLDSEDSVDLINLESSSNEDFYINGILVAPWIRTIDGRRGEYQINAGLYSYSNNCNVHINDVSLKIVSNGFDKELAVQDQNVENLYLSWGQNVDEYVCDNTIGKFSINFDDINVEDIELLELTINLTIENEEKIESKKIKRVYRAELYSSCALDRIMPT